MPSPRDLRRRIKSIGGTAQITKAMQMVAASKMRKAQEAALATAPFARRLYRMQRTVTTRVVDFHHPLMDVRPVRKRAVILIAADKGLCGALNTNVFRLASQFDRETTVFITAGRKASQFVVRTGRQLVAEFAYGDSPTSQEARSIAAFARDLFLKGDVDQVLIVATRFVNTLMQEAATIEYLPVGQITGIKVPGRRIGRGARCRHRRDAVRAERGMGPGLPAGPLPQHLYLPRSAQRQGERAERPHGVDEERDRQRRQPDQGVDARVQQAAPGQHHEGITGDSGRPGGMTAARLALCQVGT